MANDVTYRLGVIGDGAVVAAFKRIEASSSQSIKGMLSQFGSLSGALEGVSGLLGTLGVIVSVGALFEMGKQAAASADSLGKMSQKLGASAHGMAVLSAAAKLADVDLAGSTRSLAQFITTTEQAAEGAGGSANALKAVGFSAKEVKDLLGKDFVERLVDVSDKFSKIPDGARKSAAAFQLFGSRGAALIPLMNEIGSGGFDRLSDRMDAMGVRIDDDVVKSITNMNDHLKLLQIQLNLTATAAVNSFAPDISQSVEAISVAISGSGKAAATAADLVAAPFKVLLGIVLDVGIAVTGLFNAIVKLSEGVFEALTTIATSGDVQKGIEKLAEWSGKAQDVLNDANARGIKVWKTLFSPPEDLTTKPAGDAQLDDLFTKQLEALRARLDGELAIIRAKTKLAEQVQQNAYDAGLESTRDYYANRRKLAEDSAAAEISALQQVLAKQREKGDQEGDLAAAKTATEITQQRVDLQTELLKLTNDERAALRSQADEQIGLQSKLLELQGDQHAARMLAIEQEIRKADELLAKLGGASGPTQSGEAVAAVQRRARLAALREALTLEADLTQLQRDANRELDDYGRARESIQRLADAGLISEGQAQQRIIALDHDRIETLKGLAAAQLALAEATGNPEKIAAAQDFAASIDKIALEMRAATDAAAALKVAAETALEQGIGAALGDAARNARTFGEYWRQVGLVVINTLNEMIAKFIQMRIVSAALTLFGTKPSSLGIPGEVGVARAATGGLISGPGTGTSDSILTRQSTGEFDVRAAVVAQPGVLSHLQNLNRYGLAALSRSIPRFADGGIVGAVPPGARADVHLMVSAEPGLIVKQLDTPEGGDAIVRVIAARQRGIRRATGR